MVQQLHHLTLPRRNLPWQRKITHLYPFVDFLKSLPARKGIIYLAMLAFSGKYPTFASAFLAQQKKALASAEESLPRCGRGLAGDGDFGVMAPAWHAAGQVDTVSPKEQTSCTGWLILRIVEYMQ